MGAELLDFIARFAWTASWAIAAVLLTRQLMRHCFGAALAYQLWWIVPTASLATAFPTLSPTQYVLVTPALQLASYTTPAISQAGMAWCVWLLLAWAAGALAVAIGFWRAHAAFLRGLGALTEREGVHYSAAGRGPASFGLIRPRIVVPADFAQQYLPPEQTLILEHERVHIRRGDAFANLFQALLQSLLWFNPLVHLAARCFRVDQELACDAAVLRAHPGQRRNYADAMLKSQSNFIAAPGGMSCHWQSRHPLKERILILHQNPPATARRLAGRTLVALLVCGGAYSSLAARADSAPATGANTYDIAMQVRIGQTNSTPRVHVKAGESFKIVVDDQDIKLAASFVASAVGPGFVKLAGTVECGNSAASHPVLITRLGETAKVKLQDGVAAPCEVDIVVSELASAVKG